MKKEYDFSNSVRNPYAAKLKQQISIRIEKETINYFKGLSSKSGIPYQNLINLYLRECAQKKKQLQMKWS